MDLQHTTALHMIASSRNVLEISFSSAYVKLFPSMKKVSGDCHDRNIPHTNDQREILQFAGIALVLNRHEPLVNEFMSFMRSFLIDDNLGGYVSFPLSLYGL
jgi:hypothetical protein